ncbi:MAG: hypothetical protein NC393_06550 [Clostridium sp.]|nr:hypothetical protein [Clostridium sp.]MCM1171772.1 hypothetical protein [Clostridium sp.]MCM1207970.1 hypothetical protein [Ruminococcus sp.]
MGGFVGNEIFRIFNNRKLWLVMCGMLLLNIGVLLVSFSMDEISPSEYRQAKKEAGEQTDIFFEHYMNDMEAPLYKRLFDEYVSVQEYNLYVQEVMDNADESSQVSIFQDEFSKNNFKKTKGDYSKFKEVVPQFTGSYGLERAINFFATDIIVFVVIIITVNALVMQDKKSGVLNLLKATRYGDGRLIFTKALAAFLYVGLFGIVVYAVNIVMAVGLYGEISFDAPVQSMLGYAKTAIGQSIGSFVVSAGVHKIFTYGVLTALAVLFAILSSNEVIMYVLFGILCAVEFSTYVSGKLFHNMFLKRITIINMLDLDGFYQYYNYNILNKPISAIFVDILLFAVLIIAVLYICTYVFVRKETEYRNVAKYRGKWKKGKIYGLTTLDGYKFLFGYKVIFVLIAILVLQFVTYKDKHARWYENELYYRSYMKQIEGEVTDVKVEFINSEVLRMQELHEKLEELDYKYNNDIISYTEYENLSERLQNELKKENAVLRCKKYVDYILSREESDVEFVYDRGWNYLFGSDTYRNDVKNAAILMFAVLIGVAFMYGEEYRYGMDKLINISAKHKQLQVKKAGIILLYIAIMFLLMYLTELLWANWEFGLTNGNISCVSIMRLSNVNGNISIWGYCALLWMIRFTAICVISIVTALLCKCIKNSNYAMILVSLIVILPLLLNLLGIHAFDKYSFNSLLSGNMLLQ